MIHVSVDWNMSTAPATQERGQHQKLNYRKMSMRALKSYLCRPGYDDDSVILCSRKCESLSHFQFGQEYIRRLEL